MSRGLLSDAWVIRVEHDLSIVVIVLIVVRVSQLLKLLISQIIGFRTKLVLNHLESLLIPLLLLLLLGSVLLLAMVVVLWFDFLMLLLVIALT